MTDFQLAALRKAIEHLDLAEGALRGAGGPPHTFLAGLLETVKILLSNCLNVSVKEAAVRQVSMDAREGTVRRASEDALKNTMDNEGEEAWKR